MADVDGATSTASHETKLTTRSPRRRDWVPRIGYGLPCADCGAYYAANLEACPVCNSTERVPPFAGDCAEAFGVPKRLEIHI